MVRYLLKRLGRGILTILLSVTLVFFIVRAMPSNPVDLMVSPQMSEEAQQALIEEFGLDQSKLTQYGLYMKELLHGNLGSSFAKRIPVSQYIAEKLPWTLLLLAAVMLIVIRIRQQHSRPFFHRIQSFSTVCSAAPKCSPAIPICRATCV